MLTLSVPDHYAYVLLAGAGTGWLTLWQGGLTAKYRKKAKVLYPQAYAEQAEVEKSQDALRFNCVQRAHQNTMEFIPSFLFSLLVGGLKYPTLTASLGGVWLFGRVIYTLGYSSGIPAKRNRGKFIHLAYVGLLLTASCSVGKLVYATL